MAPWLTIILPILPCETIWLRFDDFRRFDREIAVVRYQGNRRRVTTYGELAGFAGRFAALLEQQGIGPGRPGSAVGGKQRGVDCGFLWMHVARSAGGAAGRLWEAWSLPRGWRPM
jgi:hypothetical protein